MLFLFLKTVVFIVVRQTINRSTFSLLFIGMMNENILLGIAELENSNCHKIYMITVLSRKHLRENRQNALGITYDFCTPSGASIHLAFGIIFPSTRNSDSCSLLCTTCFGLIGHL
jgi:hypothetical protein